VYFVELYSQGAFLDDRTLRLQWRECLDMSDPLSSRANPEIRGTAPVQFFKADGGAPPAGTQATPRPPGRPREVPPGGLPAAVLHLFEDPWPSGAPGTGGTTGTG
jgi:hypothetical protein